MIGLIQLLTIVYGLWHIAVYAEQEDERCFYAYVSDGDTVKKEVVTYKAGKVVKLETIRLHGIDAPESDQPYGQWAKRQLEKECKSKWLWGQNHGIGHYGRTIETLWNHYHDINRHMVRIGAAHPLDKKYNKDAIHAIKHGLGLWQAKLVIHPKSWRDGTKQKNPHKYYLKLYS